MTKALHIKLQDTYMDIMWAHEEVALVKQQVKQKRKEVDGFHQHIYNTAVALASEVGLLEETPRVTGWQQHRTNPEASTPCEFYHHSTAWPLLDHLQVQLEEQFSAGLQSARHLHHFDYLALWSSKEGWATEELTLKIFSMYETDLPYAYATCVELQVWYLKWHGNPNNTEVNTAPKVLQNTDKVMYPNITTLLRVAATLPVTSAMCERSISTLHLLKTHLRSIMTNSQMNGLAMMFNHWKRSSQKL